MQTRFVCVWAALVVSCAMAQLPPFAVLPDVPKFVEDNAPHADLNEFIRLWKQTLQNDGQGDAPTVRINFEPKTIVAPNDFQMLNIVPQHVSNPLLDLNASYADLRREFLLDHILLDPVQLDDPALNTPQGLRMMTFSGKDLIFRFDEKLGLVADGVAVTSAMSLQDATRMLTTDGVLFDAKLRVNNVAQGRAASSRASSDLDSPLGPPLDLESEPQVLSQPQPPAPLTPKQLAEIATALPPRHISPPALPPGAIVHPPAAPPATRGGRIAAPPAGPPAAAGKSLLSTADALESQLLPLEHRTLDSDQGPSISGSSQAFALLSLKEFAEIYGIDSQDEALKPDTLPSSRSHSTHQSNILSKPTQRKRHPITHTVNAQGTQRGSTSLKHSLHTNFTGNASPSSVLLSDSPQVGVPLPGLALTPQEGVPQPGQFSVSPKEGVSQFGLALPPQHGVSLPGPSFVSPPVGVPLPGVGLVPAITSNDLTSGTAVISELLEQQEALLDDLEEELESIADIMKEQDLGACLEMLEDTGLLDQLLDEDSGTFLLLSPSNEALARLSSEDLQELKESQQFSYHVIPLGDMPAPEVTDDSTFTTLLGQPVRFNVYEGKVFVNGAGLLRGDIKVPRGTIQVVDTVLRPPYGDLQTVLQRVDAPVGRTATLVAMHGRALHRDGPVTVFAPLDASITSKGFSWPDLLENSEMASGLLEGHTVSGSWYTEGLVRQRSLMSTSGVNITFRNMGDGTITANGIPLLMSDLSATDGVVHVVADLIPNADLGTDPNQIRTPLFDLIKDGGIKASQNHFNSLQFSLGSAGAATVKSVHDSSSRQRTNVNVGVPLSTNSGNVPQLSALYQTPIQESFDFNQVLSQSTPEVPAQSPVGTQNDGYDIAAPDASLTLFSDSGVDSVGAYGVQDQVGPSEQHEGSSITQDNNNFPNNVQFDASGDTTYGIQDQLESLGPQEGSDLSLNSQNVNTFQSNAPFDITADADIAAPDASLTLFSDSGVDSVGAYGVQDQVGPSEEHEGSSITQDNNNFPNNVQFDASGDTTYGIQDQLESLGPQEGSDLSLNSQNVNTFQSNAPFDITADADIAAPDASLTLFSDSEVDSVGVYGVQDQVEPSEQHEGSSITQDNNNFPNNVQFDASGDTTYGIQDQLESLGPQEGSDLSLNSQNVNTFQSNAPFDITADANFGVQNQGSITVQEGGDGPITSNQDTNDFNTVNSFGVTGGIDYDVQEQLVPIDQQQEVFTSSNIDLGNIDYQLTDADIRTGSDYSASSGYGVSTQSNDGYSDNPSVTTSIDQIAGTVGVSEPAVLPTLDHSRPIVELNDQLTTFDTTGTIVSAPVPAPQGPSVPSFLTLYNAPNLSPAERRDPFTEVAAPQLAGKQFLNNRVDTLAVSDKPTQKALLGAPAETNSLTETVNFISIPKPTPGVINPFDLSELSSFATFKKEDNETNEASSSNATNNHDSFFVITKGDLNLQDIISTLDENIRKDIQILESPSIFFNSSVAELALQNHLSENLLSQIRNSISSNNINPSVLNDETLTPISQGKTDMELRNESQSVEGRTIEEIFDDIQMLPVFNFSESITLGDENEVNLPTATTSIPETTETTEFFDYEDLTVTTTIPIQIARDNLNVPQSFPQRNKEFMSGPSHEGQSLTTPHVIQRNRPHLLRTTLIRSSPLQQQRNSVQLPTQTIIEDSSPRGARNQGRQSTRQRQRTTVRMQVQQHFEQEEQEQNTQSTTGTKQLSNNLLQNSTNLLTDSSLPNTLEQASTQTENEEVTNFNQDVANVNQTERRTTLTPGTLQIQQDERRVSLPFRVTNVNTTTELAAGVNQTSNFTIEGEELQSSRQKSLEPITGLFNILELQEQEKHIQDQKFPIVEVFATESIDIIDSSTSVPELIENLTEQSTLPVDTTEGTSNQVALQVQGLVSESQVPLQLDLPERDGEVPSSLEEEKNVIEFLRSQNLTAFADMIEITGLNRDMIRGGPWTIFAPSNEGVEIVRMSGGLDLSLKDLRHLTAYHVVPGVLTSDRFREGARLPTLYAGYSIYMKSSEMGQWSVGGGLVTGFSTTHPGSSTWVVHEVDRVLYAPHGNLLTTISLAPALTRFTELLTGDAETQQILQGRNPVTVFAPSNAAMGRIRPDVRPSSAWLMAHIVEGFHYSVCFPRNMTLPSLAATSIATTTNDTNGVVSINGVPASYLDITASNGVLHVLDDLVVFS